jgi:hypothetical protein
MKALISSTEISNVTWVTSWEEVTPPTDPVTYQPKTTSTIEDTMRVAEVVEVPFEVNPLLFWVDCPDDCVADQWYYKDGSVYIKPEDVPQPV